MELITSRSNPLLVHIRKLLKSRSYRRETGQCVSDGVKLLEEALRWSADLITVLVTPGVELPHLPSQVRCAQVPRDVMASLSPMKAPQGALFSFRMPPLTPPAQLTGRRYLVLDGVQDPGQCGNHLAHRQRLCRGRIASDRPLCRSLWLEGNSRLYGGCLPHAGVGDHTTGVRIPGTEQ